MLVSLIDMKNFLGIALGDLTQDDFLTFQTQLVSDSVEEYCNRKFSLTTYVQTLYEEDLEGLYPNKLPLHQYPIDSVTKIEERSTESGTPTPIVEYRLNKSSGYLVKSSGRFFDSGGILEVTYSAGYSTLPSILQSVVYGVVQERFNKKKNGIDLNFGTDVQRISIPGTISIDFDYSLNNNERKTHLGQILGSYVNLLDGFRSDRAVIGNGRLIYVE
jgi:hypothetical protein